MFPAIILVLGLVIALVLLSALIHTYYLAIAELPRKVGYLGFAGIVFCIIVFLGILTFLLSEGYLGYRLVSILIFVVAVLGVYLFRKELVASVKTMFRKKSEEASDGPT